ncbi:MULTISPECIES: metallophosphoesterase family protein [unclassified Lentimonas]|uniref:purple acid phosphatase family protein n=1 Tax=unclassified Lentimonas TaxID=2630993 RepID=UPI001326C4A9|nr:MULTISPECIES: metallophosphoesterase family protein [unclassified Lentimonas]CAA6693096.1 Unannotated [Lentimonas sp. CC19]CAA6695663.1 Unannotated [Lentimonas sp. CC10]CAA7071520.1 Unannotated [Lentimonas sp. CC11]
MKRLLLLLSFISTQLWAQPQHILFTYMGDPSTTLAVNWQSAPGESSPVVYYDTVSREGNHQAYSYQSEGQILSIPDLEDRAIYRVNLQDLEPATTYFLTVGNAEFGFSPEIKVKTIPQDDTALRFVTGGDMGTSEDVRTLLRHSATFDPNFAVIGGDIAYANGLTESVDKWDTWLSYYTEEMITSEGHTIPLVLAIGNHEVRGGFNKTKAEVPFYFTLFGQEEERSYFTRQFGKNLVFFVLDTSHVASHESQVEWLEKAFTTYQDIRYTAAVYHVPLYPSHRDFTNRYSELGRKHWGPIFDRHQLTVAFENHDHTYKRSHLLKHDEVTEDGQGTLYLGDGCWGRNTRAVSYHPREYLKQSGAIKHFWVADCSSEKMVYRAVDLDNQVFDVYPETEPEAQVAQEIFDAKEQNYILPDGVVSLHKTHTENDRWIGGEVTITVKNPFSTPLDIQLKAKFADNKITGGSGLPHSFKQIAPGAEEQLLTSFHLRPEADAHTIDIVIGAETRDPESDRVLRFWKTDYLWLTKPTE